MGFPASRDSCPECPWPECHRVVGSVVGFIGNDRNSSLLPMLHGPRVDRRESEFSGAGCVLLASNGSALRFTPANNLDSENACLTVVVIRSVGETPAKSRIVGEPGGAPPTIAFDTTGKAPVADRLDEPWQDESAQIHLSDNGQIPITRRWHSSIQEFGLLTRIA